MDEKSTEVEIEEIYIAPSITVTLNKADVDEEVAKATDYTGSKLIEEDGGARDRILMSDEDQKSLKRFWTEGIDVIIEKLKEIVANVEDSTSDTKLTLTVSKAYDTTLNSSVQSSLRSFVIAYIIGRWFQLANKQEATDYIAQAEVDLGKAERLLYSRRRPTPPRKTVGTAPIV